ASALGVSEKPVSRSTWSRTISSWARRLATSGAMPPVSLRITSILRPATVSPCCCMYSLMPLSAWAPGSANCPEYGRISPILIVCWALAVETASNAAAMPPKPITIRCIANAPSNFARPSVLHRGLERILYVLDLVELDIDELAADLVHAADIDGL